jgi:RND family efflux transporter MFP subunit
MWPSLKTDLSLSTGLSPGFSLAFALACLLRFADAHAGPAIVVAEPSTTHVVLTGYTRARARMLLTTEVSGRVVRVTADVGDMLTGDGVFACLDTTFTELDVEANLADQGRSRAEIAFYRKEVRRFKDLAAQGNAAPSELDNAQRNLAVQEQQLRALAVQHKRLRERLERSCVKGPPGWRVITRQAEPGEWLKEGDPVGELGDFQTLVVPFALTAAELAVVGNSKTPLRLELPDEGVTVSARVLRAAPDFDAETRKSRVELALTDPVMNPRGGLRARLNLELPDPSGGVLVPRNALEERYDEYWLTRVDGAQFKVVVLGPGNDASTVRVFAREISAGDRFRFP